MFYFPVCGPVSLCRILLDLDIIKTFYLDVFTHKFGRFCMQSIRELQYGLVLVRLTKML